MAKIYTDANGVTFVNNSATRNAEMFFDFLVNGTILQLNIEDRTVINNTLIADILKEDGISTYADKDELISENKSFFAGASGGGSLPTGASTESKQDALLEELDKKADANERQPVNQMLNDLGYDAWGRPKAITDKSLFSGLFTTNVPVKKWKEEFNGVERVITNSTSVNGKLHIVPGDTFEDVTILRSYRNLRYQANRGHLYSTAGYIINPTSSMIRDFGTFTEQSGAFFRIKTNGIYGVVATTVDTTYIEDERLIYDTATLATMGIDLSKGNTYDIQFEWRGVGNYFFYINLVKVATFSYIGTRTELTMFNPSNPVSFRSFNFGGNDAMEFGCVDITSEGGDDPIGEYGSVSMDNESGQISVTGFNQPIIAVRSKLNVGSLVNTRDTLALLASAYSDQKSFMRIWSTRDFTAITDGTQTWTDYDDGHLEYLIIDPTATTPATFDTAKANPAVFGSRVGQDNTYNASALFEGRTNVYQTPGDMFIITMHRENGGATLVGATYEFSEEI